MSQPSASTSGVSYIPRRTSVSSGTNGSTSLSSSLGASGLPVPSSTISTQRTLKRSSGAAGLAPPSTVKRTSSSASSYYPSLVPSTPSTSANLSSLKADLQASATSSALSRQLANTQRENRDLLRELGSVQERLKSIEKERAVLLAREDKSLSRDAERDALREEERRALVTSLGELRSRCAVVEEERDRLASEKSRIAHEREIADEEKRNAEEQLAVLQEELERVDEDNQRYREQDEELRQAKTRVEELERQLATRPSSTEEPEQKSVSEVLRSELHHQVQHLRTLEHNNSRLTRELSALKAERSNAELLKEEKLSLETKLRRMEALRSKMAEAESENAALRREKEEWAAFLKRSAAEGEESFDSPSALAKTLAQTRIESLSLREKLAAKEAGLASRDSIIASLEARVEELENVTLAAARKENISLSTRIASLERNRQLDEKELSMLREQLQTYSTEEAAFMQSSSSTPATSGNEESKGYESQKSLQIKHLEELLEAHKVESARATKEAQRLRGMLEARGDDTETIDADMDGNVHVKSEKRSSIAPETPSKSKDHLKNSLSEQIRRNEELSEDLRNTRSELTLLETECESLEAQIDALHLALGRGEYNTSTTKVLAFTDNPASQDLAIRTETLDRLREENKALLSRLEAAQRKAPSSSTATARQSPEQSSSDPDTVPRQTLTNLQAENEALQGKIEQAEKSRQRLKEVFAKTAQDLRDACRSLFGYKIEPLSNGRIQLTSIFGGKDWFLVFGPPPPHKDSEQPQPRAGSSARFQLVGGKEEIIQSNRVQTALEFWVGQRDCLPCFLSNLTTELYEETTRGRTAGWTDAA